MRFMLLRKAIQSARSASEGTVRSAHSRTETVKVVAKGIVFAVGAGETDFSMMMRCGVTLKNFNRNLDITDNGLHNLAEAIIRRAIIDYKAAYRNFYTDPFKEENKNDLEEVESFFLSDWFETLSDLNGRLIIEKIQKQVKNERRENE